LGLLAATPARAILLRSGGGAPSAQVAQFFNRLITLPSPANQALYAAYIDGLVADGVWPSLDVLVVRAAPDEGTSAVNLISGNFYPQEVEAGGVPAFTAYQGWTGASPNLPSMDSAFNPTTAGGNYTKNSASIGSWNLTTAQFNTPLIKDSTDTLVEIWPQYSNDTTPTLLNNASPEQSSANAGDSSGFWVISRTSSSGYSLYHNGTLITAYTVESSAVPNTDIVSDPGNFLPALYFAGGALTGTQITAIYNRNHTLLHAFGAV
jgi:hypothetical protein